MQWKIARKKHLEGCCLRKGIWRTVREYPVRVGDRLFTARRRRSFTELGFHIDII